MKGVFGLLLRMSSAINPLKCGMAKSDKITSGLNSSNSRTKSLSVSRAARRGIPACFSSNLADRVGRKVFDKEGFEVILCYWRPSDELEENRFGF